MTDFIFKYSGKNYSILDSKTKKKITLTSPPVSIPFGIETYNGHKIINFKIPDKNSSNVVNNFFASLVKLDTCFKNLCFNKFIPFRLSNDIKNKKYFSFIKNKRLKSPIIRSYLYKFYNKYFNTDDIGGNNVDSKYILQLEISSLWFTNDSYGVILSVSDINVS